MVSHKPKPSTDKGKGRKEAAPAELAPTLYAPEFTSSKSLKQFHFLVGSGNNEWGTTKLKVVVSQNTDATMVLVFLNFLIAGLVPPFSDFFLAVLEHYKIHMLHLHPNAVLVRRSSPICVRGSSA